jgi:hypothetical protein
MKLVTQAEKYSLEQRSKKYDELDARASKILDEFNPCKIENGTCIQGRNGGCNFCCDGCVHLSEKGCTVQSLYCRTWLCEAAATAMPLKKYMIFDELMTQIDDEARKYNMYLFRTGKVESLGTKPLGSNSP